jgi:hypothetical protein
MLAPVVALFSLRGSDRSASSSRAWWASSPVLVSRFSVEPIYDDFLSWKPGWPPEHWRVARDRYFRLDQVRFRAEEAAFVLFLADLTLL